VSSVLFLNKMAPYDIGGAERVIWELGKELARQGWRVHYLVPASSSPPVEVSGIKFHFLPESFGRLRSRLGYFVGAFGCLPQLVNEIKPALIYDNASPIPFYPAHFMGLDAPIVTKIHHVSRYDMFNSKDELFSQLVTLLSDEVGLRFLDGGRIIAVSASTRERLSTLVRNSEQIQIVSPGVDIDLEEPPSIKNREKIVLYLSRLAKNKGIFDLLEAWSIVQEKVPCLHLIVAGSGPQRERLQAMVDRLELERMEFAGRVSELRKEELFKAARVFVFPTWIEGLPIAILEALNFGAPIVSTDTWGVRDVVKDGINGHLVPIRSPRRLAAAICEVADDDELATQFVSAGREIVQDYSWQRVTRKEAGLLESYIASLPRS
jgi:glycosyltransferase involved in cell wall biosynthesis